MELDFHLAPEFIGFLRLYLGKRVSDNVISSNYEVQSGTLDTFEQSPEECILKNLVNILRLDMILAVRAAFECCSRAQSGQPLILN